MNKKYLIAIIAVIVLIAGAFAVTNMSKINDTAFTIDEKTLEDRGNLVVDNKDVKEEHGYYHTQDADNNSVLIKNGGKLSLSDSVINKTGDTASEGDNVDFYGTNSAVLVNTNGSADISNVKIETNSKGSNGIFVTNSEASAADNSGGGAGGQPPEATGNGGKVSAACEKKKFSGRFPA